MSFHYHPDSEKAISSLQEEFGHSPEQSGLSVSSLLSVGATLDGDRLSQSDSKHTYGALLHMGIIRIGVSRGYTHRTLNISRGLEEDFLKVTPSTDALLIHHIPYRVEGISVTGKAGLQISDRHFLTREWEKAAIKSNPKILMTFGSDREIGPSHFAGEGSPFLHIPERVLRDCYEIARPHGHYHAATGVVLQQQYARELAEQGHVPQPLRQYLGIYL